MNTVRILAGIAWGNIILLLTALVCESVAAQPTNLRADRILFLGNSITKHGPKESIGWTGNWGMAASAQDKDYVHIVIRSVAEITGSTPEFMLETINDFEKHYDTWEMDQRLEKGLRFKPDIVILAVGENTPALETEESRKAFSEGLLKLLKALQANGDPTIVVRSCFWPNVTKDQILRQGCEEVGGVFVDFSTLGQDTSYHASSEREFTDSGVACHPGDKGMQAIADAILEALKKRGLNNSSEGE